ncbi:hypothetical protein KDRO_E00240 [Kluyveromyces lactis]|nr:hypothetical protein KDRO_E00240 [Kluyveromyces lactis]
MLDLCLFAYGLILLSYFYQKVEANAIDGCDVTDRFTFRGFVADYYHYPLNYTGNFCYDFDDTYTSIEYRYGGYETYGGGYIGSSYNINDLTFTMKTVQTDLCYTPMYGTLPEAFNYPETITLSNFTMLLSGYFYAPKSGEYQFKLNRADDFAYITMGNGSTFECCQEPDTDSNPAAFELITELEAASNATVTLKAGIFYPLQILFVNKWGNLGLNFQFVDADGVPHRTFDRYVYYFPEEAFQYDCPTSVSATTAPGIGTTTQTTNTPTAIGDCDVTDRFNFPGFVADYYHYPLNYTGNFCYDFDSTYKSSEYRYGGYETYGGGYIGSSYDITDVNFSMMTVQIDFCHTPMYDTLPEAYNYPETITLSNFTMLLSGYFYAPKSGEYQFKLNQADDFAYITMGNGSTFECCQEPDTDSNPAAFELITELDGAASDATVTLKAGVFYPLQILFVNKWGNLGLNFQFVDADGILHETFDGYVYYFPEKAFQYDCPMSVTSTTLPWTQSFISTYTTETSYQVSDQSTLPGWVVNSSTSDSSTLSSILTNPTFSLNAITTSRNNLTSDTSTTKDTSENTSDSTSYGSTFIQLTIPLRTVTTTSNGVTAVYTTTCPIGATVTEKSSREALTSNSVDESSSTELSIATVSKKDGTSSAERFPNAGTNEDEDSSTDTTTAIENISGPAANVSTTSDAATETGTDHKLNGSGTETQTMTSSPASSISEVISLYEGSAIKVLVTPFIVVFLALL